MNYRNEDAFQRALQRAKDKKTDRPAVKYDWSGVDLVGLSIEEIVELVGCKYETARVKKTKVMKKKGLM